jgi:NAD-dependent dihydropyrimidine dehydrogenase PreA subunit
MANIKKWENNRNWVKVDLDLCKAAEACVEVCPAEVYIIVDGKVNADNIGQCIECMACQGICPHEAILDHFAWV